MAKSRTHHVVTTLTFNGAVTKAEALNFYRRACVGAEHYLGQHDKPTHVRIRGAMPLANDATRSELLDALRLARRHSLECQVQNGTEEYVSLHGVLDAALAKATGSARP